MTLAMIREEMAKDKPGKWSHNAIFEYVEVALDYDLPLAEFVGLDVKQRAYMIARKRAKGTMEAWESYLHEKEMEKERKKSKTKGSRK